MSRSRIRLPAKHAFQTSAPARIMERAAEDAKADTNGQEVEEVREGAAPASAPMEEDIEQPASEDETPAPSQVEEPFNNNIPVFLDRTFRMVESVSDDVV
ncbi:unnamed protein product, partial [Ectocarpus fasciculatus]